MASLYDCIQTAMDAGEIDKARGRAAQSEFEQLVARYQNAMPPYQAQAKAAADLKEATRLSSSSRRNAKLAQLQTMVRIKHLIENAPDPALAVRNMIEFSEGSGFTGESLASVSRSLERWVNGRLNNFLKATGHNMVGSSRNRALLTDVIKILHGDEVNNPVARALANEVEAMQDDLRRMFNAHGGDIGKLKDFGVSHAHNAARLRQRGFKAWHDEIVTRLDWSRIPDLHTGKPFAAAKGEVPPPDVAARFLKDIYEGITSGGWTRREPSMAMGGKALYNQRADHRVLHFLSGEDWLAYNKTFGQADPFTAVVGGLHRLARDVAQMRALGPNPRASLDFAAQVAEKRMATVDGGDAVKRVRKQAALARTMLNHFDGSVNHTEWEGTARFFGTVRKTLGSVQLGSATISSVTDLQTMAKAAAVVGMKPRNVLSRATQLAASKATRETAARMGYVADTLADAGAAQARFMGDVMAGELADRLSGFTMRASGLAYWTDMNRLAFQYEFAGYMAENAARDFDGIDAPLRALFQKRGLGAAEWDLLRAPEARLVDDATGADFISPLYWLEHQTALPRREAEGLAFRIQAMIEDELEMGVPTMRLEGAARMIGDTTPGTLMGELARSGAQYKSFTLTFTLGQIRRFSALPTPMAKVQYAASMGTGLLLLGALAVQLKEISKGRDPRPMTDLKFWGAAGMQSGGLGIFGDFFASETSRAGGGLAETLGGPVVGLASTLIRMPVSNAARVAQGQDSLLGRDVANFVRYNTPVASSLWYERAAFDRLVADNIQRFLDPEAEAQFRRIEKTRERNYGSPSWWRPGEAAPGRGPDLSNAMRTR